MNFKGDFCLGHPVYPDQDWSGQVLQRSFRAGDQTRESPHRGRNSRVFGEKICDKFITKFGKEFSESPISSPNLVKNPVRSPNLVTNSVTYFVRNVVAHLYLHQI